MSDTVLRIIPSHHQLVPPEHLHKPALRLLEAVVGDSEDPEVRVYPQLEYIDAGENEEGATCPACRVAFKFDYFREDDPYADWFRDVVHETEGGAEGYRTTMPCCGTEVLFPDVLFEASGFARFEVQVSNPDTDYPLSEQAMGQLEALLGCQLRQVWAHY